MNTEDYGRIAYLLILAVAIGGWFLAENRGNLGKSARQAVAWGLIFVGVVAGYGLWSDIRDDVMPRQSVIGQGVIEVPRGFDGHYRLTLNLNNVPVNFIVDTGASDVLLTREDAQRVGLDLNDLVFSGIANTANGTVTTAHARIANVRLGDISDQNLSVSVNGGDMDGSLLGMTYLQRFQKIEIAAGKLILTR